MLDTNKNETTIKVQMDRGLVASEFVNDFNDRGDTHKLIMDVVNG
jgi:hypothetical protein